MYTPKPTGRLSAARWLALVAMVAAIGWGYVSYQMLQHRLAALSRTAVPGQVTVQVAGPQELTVYYEDPPASGGFLVRTGASSTLGSSPVDLAVTGPSGATVTTAPYERDLRFTYDGRAVIALATIDAPTAGTYTIEASGDVPPAALVSVGQVVDVGLLANAAGALALFVGPPLALLVAMLVAAVKRRRVTSFDHAR